MGLTSSQKVSANKFIYVLSKATRSRQCLKTVRRPNAAPATRRTVCLRLGLGRDTPREPLPLGDSTLWLPARRSTGRARNHQGTQEGADFAKECARSNE